MKKGSARSIVNTLLVLSILLVGWFYATNGQNTEPSLDYSRSLQGVSLIETPSSDKMNPGSKTSSSLVTFRESMTSSLDKISHENSPKNTDNFSDLGRTEMNLQAPQEIQITPMHKWFNR